MIQVRFEQVSRRRQEIGKVSIQLLFRETATWKSGRSTNSAHQSTVMDTYETSGRQLAAGETLSEACVLQVPRSAMHSFSVPNNRLAWVVKVAVAIPGTPDVDEEVIVNVLPQMKEQDA